MWQRFHWYPPENKHLKFLCEHNAKQNLTSPIFSSNFFCFAASFLSVFRVVFSAPLPFFFPLSFLPIFDFLSSKSSTPIIAMERVYATEGKHSVWQICQIRPCAVNDSVFSTLRNVMRRWILETISEFEWNEKKFHFSWRKKYIFFSIFIWNNIE